MHQETDRPADEKHDQVHYQTCSPDETEHYGQSKSCINEVTQPLTLIVSQDLGFDAIENSIQIASMVLYKWSDSTTYTKLPNVTATWYTLTNCNCNMVHMYQV